MARVPQPEDYETEDEYFGALQILDQPDYDAPDD